MATSRSLNCVNCGEQMATSVEHGVEVDYCPECGGVWLDPGELEQLTGRKNHFRSRGHRHHHDSDEEDDETGGDEEGGGFFDSIVDSLGGSGEGDGGGFGGDGGGGGGGGGE